MTPEKGPQSDEMVPPSPTPTKTQDRLWLAAMAMQAVIQAGGGDAHEIARQSFLMADVMLEVGGL